MKRLFYIAAAATAVLSACTKEDPIVEVGTEPESVSMPVFKATIEGPATKTSLGNAGKVNWENGDAVALIFETEDMENRGVYNYQVTPDNDDASKAKLTRNTVLVEPDDGEEGNRLSKAVYPASLWSDVFPETQVYAGDDNIGFAPMYSHNWDLDNGTVKPTPETIEFKNAAALLKITVPYTQMTSVRSITVSSDVAMHGYLSFSVREHFLYITDGLDPGVNDHLILDCYGGNGDANVEIPEGDSKTFYIALPIPFLADGEKYGYLQIDVTDGITTKSMRTTKASGIQVQRNKIYPITFAENYIAPAAWETALTLGRNVNNGPTSIEIETGVNVSSYIEDATHKPLNAAGTLWEVLDGQVLRIQTSSNKIIGHDSFDNGYGGYLGLFCLYRSVETITGLDNLDMSEVTNMSRMFWGCWSLRGLDLSNFSTSNVTNMQEMFGDCNALERIDISSFTTSNVTTMKWMFSSCPALQELDLSNFNTENVTNMSGMFSSSSALQTLDLSYFDTENVTDMSYMFSGCQVLQTLDLSSFNTEKVTDMSGMFSECQALRELNLSSFATDAPDMSQMFCSCTSLQSLTLGDFFFPGSELWQMFDNCTSELWVYGANQTFVDIITNDWDACWEDWHVHFYGY